MKIAFVVSFFDFRNDVRKVIAAVAANHEVIILGNPELEASIRMHFPAGVEFRTIKERKNTTWNRLWDRLYLLFRKLPKSRSNFFLMELFKVSNNPDPAQQAKGRKLLKLIGWLPKFVSYDAYLNGLQYRCETNLDGISQFICFTAIADDYLMARLLHEKKAVKVYVYSWDHPCKHTCFSRKVEYFCWSAGIREDIIALQNIPEKQVKVVGASQFGYIYDYKQGENFAQVYPFRYVYFGCAIGITDLVPDELRLIGILAGCLQKAQPTWKLVVRPYPVLSNWSLYEKLKLLPNVVIDDQFRTQDLSVKETDIQKKYATIEQAEAFFHLGTTMGLEACFTDTPSFILDFGYVSQSGLSLYNFIHQYQNDKHLIDLAPQNAVTSEEKLLEVLEDPEKSEFGLLNKIIQQQYPLKSFENFARDMVNLI